MSSKGILFMDAQRKSNNSIEGTIGWVAVTLAIGSLILYFFDDSANSRSTIIRLFVIVIMALICLVVAAIIRKLKS